MKRHLILFVHDILENIKLIEGSTEKVSQLKFKLDRLLFDATLRRLEIIGEAIKNIPASFRDKYSEVPWKKISGLRDILIHAYFGIEGEIIWNIIKKDLPLLKNQMKKIFEKESENA